MTSVCIIFNPFLALPTHLLKCFSPNFIIIAAYKNCIRYKRYINYTIAADDKIVGIRLAATNMYYYHFQGSFQDVQTEHLKSVKATIFKEVNNFVHLISSIIFYGCLFALDSFSIFFFASFGSHVPCRIAPSNKSLEKKRRRCHGHGTET